MPASDYRFGEKRIKVCPHCGIETRAGMVCRNCKLAAKHGYPNAGENTLWVKDVKPSHYLRVLRYYEQKRLRKKCQPLIEQLSHAVDLGRISAQW